MLGMVSTNKFLKFLVKYSGTLITIGLCAYSYFELTDVVTTLLSISAFAQIVILFSNHTVIKRMRNRNLELLKENTKLTDDMNRQGW